MRPTIWWLYLVIGGWLQRAAQLLLDGADASEISRQIELALFYDRKLDLKASKETSPALPQSAQDERAD